MTSIDHIRLKMERAKEHLEALNEALGVFYDSRPCSVTIQFDAKNQRDIIRMQVTKRPDLRIGILAGDYVQNLRSCLDHLAWQLALVESEGAMPDRPRRVEFPISIDADISPRSRSSLDQILRYFPQDARPIIEGLQPYKAGPTDTIRKTHPLYLLDALCNLDKHRVIPVRALMMEIDIPRVPGLLHKWLDQGAIEVTIPTPHPQLPPPRAGITFGDEESGIDVMPNILGKIYNFVRKDALPRFASFFQQDPWFRVIP